MTHDEMKALIAQAADPDKTAEALTAIADEVTTLYDTVDSYAAQVAEKDKTIADLRDSNTRLFLRITTGTDTSPDDAEEKAAAAAKAAEEKAAADFKALLGGE